jgi:hypothetical protein
MIWIQNLLSLYQMNFFFNPFLPNLRMKNYFFGFLMSNLKYHHFYVAIEAKLKEKNT